MTHILLYWNHICVLHRQEKAFLQELAGRLRREGIELEVRFFGLGYPEHMSEYLARPDAVFPDLIVSADLEVFEDRAIFSKLEPELYPAADWVPLRESPALDAVRRGDKLLPAAAIPLVYYTREPEVCAQMRLPDWAGLAFGGINNSAVKTVVKTVWEKWGREAASDLLDRSLVTDMPIGAFQAVRQEQARTALVPSLYALRADGQNAFLRTPQEGPVLIPSYLCARTSAPEWAARRVAEGILCRELCDFYVTNGDLILFPACTQLRSGQEGERFCCPSAAWLDALARDDFYGLYREKFPAAIDPVQKIKEHPLV
ncbi:hypothetical protein [Pusillibacter faecalis]|uniref:hypothetical protein n=1 Tax=Pusillibacter faecalis TaxID=2714358 RepID=UPI0029422F5E|nr:hypothetical protein [Pusillibacter faecalis]